MELETGTQVGPYAIQRKLGAGGMGVVYRALDNRLGRQVAIKVLPEALKNDVDRMRRFEREARTIGALNHPNLVTLHDVGTHDGTPFLVTELLDGQSLRARLEEGRLPPREAVRIAGEIARGLAAAHGAGVTHRDIKPENIFVMGDDRVKVLDFGIAKLQTKADDDDAQAATLAGIGIGGRTSHTGTGMVVGTPGYMAPEQLGGGDVDPRTDIFALGVVLFEMLSGRRPFASDSGVGIEESYAILKQAPTDLPTSVPAAIARVVRRCLEKKPAARFQSASDLAFALEAAENASGESERIGQREAIAETVAQAAISADDLPEQLPSEHTTKPGVAPAGPSASASASGPIAEIRKRLQSTVTPTDGTPSITSTKELPALVAPRQAVRPWMVIALAAVALGAAGWIVARTMKPVMVTHQWPQLVDGGAAYHRVTFLPQASSFARFTRDQQSVVWSERRGEQWHVVTSEVAAQGMSSTSLVGRVLDVSPKDGELAIRDYGDGEGGTLKRGTSGRGAPETVALNVEDASFAPDGKTLAVIRAGEDTTYWLEYPVGTVIRRPESKSGALEWVRMARDGKRIAVVETDATPQTSGRIVVVDPTGKELARSATYDDLDGIAWSPAGDEIWFGEGSRIRALAIATKKERVLHRSVLPLGLRDVATDGRMLVAPKSRRARTLLGPVGENKFKNVGWFDGSEVRGIARDGKSIVFVESTASVHDDSGLPAFRRVGDEQPIALGHARNLALFPDGTSVLMVLGATKPLRVVNDRAAPVELPLGQIAHLDVADAPAIAWSGRWIVVRGATKDGRSRLWRYDLEDKRAEPQPVGPDVVAEGPHPITADGAWIAIADRGKGIQLHSTKGEASRVVSSGEIVPLSFDEGGTSLFVMPLHNYPRPIVKVDLATGTETPFAIVAPEDKPERMAIAIDASGTNLAFSTVIETSELFVIGPPK